MTDECSTDEESKANLRRNEDWKRITMIEFRQDIQQKELDQVIRVTEKMSKRMTQMVYIALGIMVTLIAQTLGAEKALTLLIGLI